MNSTERFFVTALFAFALHARSHAGEVVFAVSAIGPQAGRLVRIDLDSGGLEQVGPAGMGAGVSLAVDLAARPSDGELFLDSNSVTSSLFRVDRQTGLATPLVGAPVQNGLVFDDNDRLYTQLSPDNVDATGPLALLDVATGQATPLGGPPLPRLFGMAFNRMDQLIYAIAANGNSLFKIGLDGSVHSVMPTGIGGVGGALVFRRNNRLVASNLNGQLIDIDTVTGAVSNPRLIQGGFPAQGMATIIPEPAGILLAAFGIIIGTGRRRRNRAVPLPKQSAPH